MPPMPINYTTKIEVDKTVAEIEALLRRHGAVAVSKGFDHLTRRVVGVTFTLATDAGPQTFELPVRADAIYRKLWGARKRIPYGERAVAALQQADRAQAERVAWRVAKDWLEVQLTLVSVGMASATEALFPYLLAPSGETVYEAYRQSALPAPAPSPERR